MKMRCLKNSTNITKNCKSNIALLRLIGSMSSITTWLREERLSRVPHTWLSDPIMTIFRSMNSQELMFTEMVACRTQPSKPFWRNVSSLESTIGKVCPRKLLSKRLRENRIKIRLFSSVNCLWIRLRDASSSRLWRIWWKKIWRKENSPSWIGIMSKSSGTPTLLGKCCQMLLFWIELMLQPNISKWMMDYLYHYSLKILQEDCWGDSGLLKEELSQNLGSGLDMLLMLKACSIRDFWTSKELVS